MSCSLRAVLGAAALVLALPGVANAATLQVDSSSKTNEPFRFHYHAAPGEANNLRVAQGADGTTFIDDAVAIRIDGDSSLDGCRLEADGDAVCAPGVNPFAFNLGDGNDRILYQGADPVSGGINAGDGNDTIFAGARRGPFGQRAPGVLPISGGAGTADKVSYEFSPHAVTVTLDGLPNDGSFVDDQNVKTDVEVIEGSDRADTITGSNGSERECFVGGDGNDVINGLDGTDVFDEGTEPNGSDTYNGAAGIDLVDYSKRTAPVNVALDNVRNDGAAGEQDFVDPNVNDVFGGSAGDTITGAGGRNVVFAGGGVDTVSGLGGNDELHGGAGVDTLLGGEGDDLIETVDNTADVIRCEGGLEDTLTRDLRDVDATGCEIVNSVGTLALKAKGANVALSWSHPRSWRQLRSVTLRLRGAGKVVIRPRAGSIKASGKVAVVRGKLSHRGKTVTARLKLRLPAGKRLVADVIAVDVRGNRQVERRAAIIRR